MPKATHLRIHIVNDITWCHRQITPDLNVVTFAQRMYDIGQHAPRPLTPELREEYDSYWNETTSQVTCKKCTANGKRFTPKTVATVFTWR